MPGIYVNDGGATSSAIGNILGGIAQEVGPEGAAKAALLAQQTQGADLANEDAWNKIVSGSNIDIPGLTRTLNMNAPDPNNPSSSGVAGTVSSLAMPPGTRGPGGRLSTLPDETGYTPEQKYLLNEAINGRLGSEALGKDVDTFSTPLVGAGMTPGAIRTRATQPLAPGQRVDISGTGAGPYETGGSVYDEGVAKAEAAANPVEADRDIAEGNAAYGNLGKMNKVLAVYDKFIAPNTDSASILTDELKTRLSEATGIDLHRFGTVGDARTEIGKLFAGMVVNLRDSQGNPMFKGGLPEIMAQFPDVKADPVRFRSSLGALQTSLNRQAKDGDAAFNWKKNQSRDNFLTYQEQKRANAIAEGQAYSDAGMKIRQGGGEGGDGGDGSGGGGAGGGGGGGGPPKPAKGKHWVWNEKLGRTELVPE